MHDYGMGIYLYWHTLPVSNQLRKPGCDMWSQYQIICWTQNLNLHPGTLESPHLSVSPSTCWHIELSILGLLRFSISIHLRISFSCSMKFFHLKRALGLITLGRIWCPVSTFACFRGRAFLGTPYSSPYVAKLNKSVWSETSMLSAIG